MQTGDGLLVRLLPIGSVPLAAFAGLCRAARKHGNGVIEITARGSIQVRGLAPASAPRFAAAVGVLGIAANDGVAVHTNPLAGIADAELLDGASVAADLRGALARQSLGARLSPKVSVVIDGGGALGLDGLSADVRLRAELINGDVVLRVCVGGDGSDATQLGIVRPASAVETAIRLLELIAQRDRDTRARDIVAMDGSQPFGLTIRDLLLNPVTEDPIVDSRLSLPPTPIGGGNERNTAIGQHRLRNGSFAYGFALAFGHAEAATLECLIQAAERAQADGVIAAPGRALIAVGIASDNVCGFAADAGRLGFITRSDDPRRHVIACAGAPFCASAHIAARTMAPAVAAATAQFLGDSFSIHISGCTKGCAHPGAAALTVAGAPDGCALIANGAARDSPFAMVGKEELSAEIARYVGQLTGKVGHG